MHYGGLPDARHKGGLRHHARPNVPHGPRGPRQQGPGPAHRGSAGARLRPFRGRPLPHDLCDLDSPGLRRPREGSPHGRQHARHARRRVARHARWHGRDGARGRRRPRLPEAALCHEVCHGRPDDRVPVRDGAGNSHGCDGCHGRGRAARNLRQARGGARDLGPAPHDRPRQDRDGHRGRAGNQGCRLRRRVLRAAARPVGCAPPPGRARRRRRQPQRPGGDDRGR
mmetsp:Transcript_110730/g.313267  ORF Transcript_110730/g.313267 Transcript_110730/m.313267 type:complete len:226 (-) Transcript_110730:1399-2076(-)